MLPLVLSASDDNGIGLAGPTVRDLPVESLTCKACGRSTFTRDLPPIGIDVAAVLEQLTDASPTTPPTHRVRAIPPTCPCGSRTLTWSSVVVLTVHTAGETMLGEVTAGGSVRAPSGTLTCGACSRSWDLSSPDLPPQVQQAATAFSTALTRGDVRSAG